MDQQLGRDIVTLRPRPRADWRTCSVRIFSSARRAPLMAWKGVMLSLLRAWERGSGERPASRGAARAMGGVGGGARAGGMLGVGSVGGEALGGNGRFHGLDVARRQGGLRNTVGVSG